MSFLVFKAYPKYFSKCVNIKVKQNKNFFKMRFLSTQFLALAFLLVFALFSHQVTCQEDLNYMPCQVVKCNRTSDCPPDKDRYGNPCFNCK